MYLNRFQNVPVYFVSAINSTVIKAGKTCTIHSVVWSVLHKTVHIHCEETEDSFQKLGLKKNNKMPNIYF